MINLRDPIALDVGDGTAVDAPDGGPSLKPLTRPTEEHDRHLLSN